MVTEPINRGELYADSKSRHFARVVALNDEVVLMRYEGKRVKGREFSLPRWFLSNQACGWHRTPGLPR